MSDRKHTRLMMLAVTLGLVLAYFSQCGPAHADPMLLPAGSTVQAPGQQPVTLGAPHFVFTRPMIDRANAAAETSRRLTGQLRDCTRAVVKATKPEPGWQIGLRWFAIGAAVSGAFIGGLML